MLPASEFPPPAAKPPDEQIQVSASRLLSPVLTAALFACVGAHGADKAVGAESSAAGVVAGKRDGKSARRPEPAEDPRRIAAQEEAKERAEEAKQAEARRISRERRAREEEGRWLARSKACVIKPVMSDEEIRRCRESGSDPNGR